MSKVLRTTRTGAMLVAAALLGTAALAQKISGITVEPTAIVSGGQVKVTVNLDVMSGTNCGLRLHWGDGAADNIKVNQKKDVPWIASHSYAKAGSYEVMVEPKTQGMVPRCGGDNQRVKVAVTAPPPPPKAIIGATAAPLSPCPEGWKLARAGVHKTTKAFTCTAAANTKLPEQRLACPGNLDYFENAKKGHLGCKA